MKSILSTLVLSFVLSFLLIASLCTFATASDNNAGQIHYLVTPGFSEIKRMAKEQNKPIFINFTASWCGYCRKLDKEIFRQSDVAEYMNRHYINYKVDVDYNRGARLAAFYKIYQLPTLIFVKPNGEVIFEDSYFYNKEQFLDAAKNAHDRFLGKAIPAISHVSTPAPVSLSVAENSKASIHAEMRLMGKCKSSDKRHRKEHTDHPKGTDAYIPELEADNIAPAIL